jgi:hypothetical protein
MLDSRQVLINSAVEYLNVIANRNGFHCISEETLATIIEAYKQKYTPPKHPKGEARKNGIESLLEAIRQPKPSNVISLDSKRKSK